MKITTNNVPRDVLNYWELSDRELKDFDYYDAADYESSPLFFRYKKNVYALDEFEIVRDIEGWEGIKPEGFFFGILVRYGTDDNESVVVGRYVT